MKKLFAMIIIAALLMIQLATPVFACEPTPRTQGYWKNHECVWQVDEKLCDCYTWLDVLNTPTGGDAWYILAHQYIACRLNINYQNCPWEPALLDAEVYLKLGPGNIPDDIRPMVIDLAERLDAFNNGCFD